MTSLLVSIIVPCYQQGKYLKEALTSISNQSYSNWECLIIDDGSTDETSLITEEFSSVDKRFKYFFKDNNGVSEARNLGLETARGEFIQFLDADDQLQPEKIEKQIEFLNKNPQIDIIYGSSRYFFDGDDDLFPTHHTGFAPAVEMHYSDQNQLATLFLTNVSTICASIYRRSIFKNGIKFYDVAFEDFLFHIECAINGFCFHFERFNNSHCLIRMTKSSQMEKHKKLDNQNNSFHSALHKMKEIYGLLTPSDIESIAKENYIIIYMKRIVNNLMPPVIIKFIKYLSTKSKK